jgi:hypothetical protein
MSDYLEGSLNRADRNAVELHLKVCAECNRLLAGMAKVLDWGKAFPVYEPPEWLQTRIVANVPIVNCGRCEDTLAAVWKWIFDPRAAMGVFTAMLVLSWLGNLAGISPDWTTVVRNPAAIYYEAQGAVNRAYDGAVRRYYRSALVTGIKTRIEQLREIS